MNAVRRLLFTDHVCEEFRLVVQRLQILSRTALTSRACLYTQTAMVDEREMHFDVDIVESGNRFGYLGPGGEFRALSNFTLEIASEVKAGPMSGYVCHVTQYNGQMIG